MKASTIEVRHPKADPLDVPYYPHSAYFYRDLLSMANAVLNGTAAKTTVDYWVVKVFGVARPRSIRCSEADLRRWATYLSFWVTYPRSQVNRAFDKYN
ncbi:MAG: hypothetical protein ACR2FS_15170 [Phormidesmis sp.]